PLREVLRIGREIATGLHAAHAAGLVHRDMKPENVFLEGPARRVKIIDFGLVSDASDDATRLTTDGTIIGTPAYMAPERIASDATVDARADLFSLGVMLYELLARRLPFEGTSLVSMLAAISRGRPRPLGEVAADVPPDVAALVMRLIAHDPDDRPADAASVATELEAIEERLAADDT
ncbi:MAG TPA: serine/threonine-protein kinase PknK, partial [Planctomycetaceae bacterium]|nr:serine/threonine-protein kinase PknK [Planctomycetaceae bacterium]